MKQRLERILFGVGCCEGHSQITRDTPSAINLSRVNFYLNCPAHSVFMSYIMCIYALKGPETKIGRASLAKLVEHKDGGQL